jgi:hypothetical protein
MSSNPDDHERFRLLQWLPLISVLAIVLTSGVWTQADVRANELANKITNERLDKTEANAEKLDSIQRELSLRDVANAEILKKIQEELKRNARGIEALLQRQR